MNQRSPSSRRIVLLGLLLFLVAGVLSWVLWLPEKDELARAALETAAETAGVDWEFGEISFQWNGSLILRDIDLADLGHLDYLGINWSWSHLLNRKVHELRVHGLELRQSELVALANEKKRNRSARSIKPFLLETLIIGQAVLVLDNLGPGIPPLPVRLGEVTPLVFQNLRLGGAESDPAAQELQKVAIHDLHIYSPYDPLAEVLSFEKIELQFSWAGIQSQHLQRLTFQRPVIYVGDDLFWFVDQVQQKESNAASGAPSVPWSIGTFDVVGGRLTVTTFGRPGFTLPVIYEAEMSALVLSDFAETPLKTNLTIPNTNLNYPEYGVRVSNMRGDLKFSLPPDEEGTDNIVGTIYLDSASWKGVTSTDAWVTLTFDKNGIYGELGGETYGGYTTGNLSVLVNQGLEWFADASVTNTEVRAIAEKLAPEHIVFNGPVTGLVSVQGRQKEIVSLEGQFDWSEPGDLTVVAIDDLLDRLPGDWHITKKDMATLALEAFRQYDYDQGFCSFRFTPPTSYMNLDFQGMQGKREFQIRWHDLRLNPGFGW